MDSSIYVADEWKLPILDKNTRDVEEECSDLYMRDSFIA